MDEGGDEVLARTGFEGSADVIAFSSSVLSRPIRTNWSAPHHFGGRRMRSEVQLPTLANDLPRLCPGFASIDDGRR